MAVAGLPEPTKDNVEKMLDFALALQSSIQQGPGHLQIRIGVNVGPVVAGVIGHHKFSYDVWGDTVNTASRMESHGAPGKIHVTAAVYEAAKNLFDLEKHRTVTVKGKGAMATYYLIGRRSNTVNSRSLESPDRRALGSTPAMADL